MTRDQNLWTRKKYNVFLTAATKFKFREGRGRSEMSWMTLRVFHQTNKSYPSCSVDRSPGCQNSKSLSWHSTFCSEAFVKKSTILALCQMFLSQRFSYLGSQIFFHLNYYRRRQWNCAIRISSQGCLIDLFGQLFLEEPKANGHPDMTFHSLTLTRPSGASKISKLFRKFALKRAKNLVQEWEPIFNSTSFFVFNPNKLQIPNGQKRFSLRSK